MRRHAALLISLALLPLSAPLHAQLGGTGSPTSPQISPEMIKLFGDHKAFSARMDFQVTEQGADSPMTLPGQLAVQDGKSRFEMNLAEAKGGRMPPNAAAQMKQMGMDRIIAINRPDEKRSLLIYPGLEAYVETVMDETEAGAGAEELNMEKTAQGRETVGGHECTKSKVVFTDKNGETQETLVWNATDLKDFPVKIEAMEQGNKVVMVFKEVDLTKPDTGQFDAPSAYAKYDDMMTMMQQVMMKRMRSGTPAN